MTSSDSALLERARRGDRQALATLYDDFAPAIYRYLYRRLGDARLAEDLTGQVFLKLLEALRRDQPWSSSFRGWLYRIAHNLVVDHFRRRGDGLLVELEEWLESEGGDLDRPLDEGLQLQQVRRALRELTEEQCQVILLRFGEGLSNREVAAIMGRSEGAVKALQHRALQALRHLLVEERMTGRGRLRPVTSDL